MREVERALKGMLYDEAGRYGAAGEQALYWELRNMAARYFQSCADPGYNRGVFGLVSSDEAGRRARMARDAWQIARGLAGKLGLEARLGLWSQAVLDAYREVEPDADERLRACEGAGQRRR